MGKIHELNFPPEAGYIKHLNVFKLRKLLEGKALGVHYLKVLHIFSMHKFLEYCFMQLA